MGTAKKRLNPSHGKRRETADFDWEQFISASTGKAGTGISCGELGDRLGITPRHALTLLHRLIKSGKVAYLRHETRPTICGRVQKIPVYGVPE